MGRIRSFCFFTLLFVVCKTQDSISSEDLRTGGPTSDEDSKSAAYAESVAFSNGGQAHAEANSVASSSQSLTSSQSYGSSLSQATAQANAGSEQYLSPYGQKEMNLLSSGLVGPNSVKTQADAVAQINKGMNLYTYQQGVQPNHYNSISSAQAQAQSQSLTNSGGNFYNSESYPYYYNSAPNHNSDSSFSQPGAQALFNYEGLYENKLPTKKSQGNQYPLIGQSVQGSAQVQLEALAQANADVLNPGSGFNTYIPGYVKNQAGLYPHPNDYQGKVNQNSASQALSEAQVVNLAEGGYDQEMNMYQPGRQKQFHYPGSLSTVDHNSGLNLFVPGYQKPTSAQASAGSQALINSAGGGYNPGINPYQPGYLPFAQSSSQAQAQFNSGNYIDGQGYNQNVPNSYKHGVNSAQMKADASAFGSTGGLYGPAQNSQAMSDAKAISGGLGSALVNAKALSGGVRLLQKRKAPAITRPEGYSRVIPTHEYIMPHLLQDIETVIICSSEGEMHNLWSPVHNCLVCACIRQIDTLVPVCARCNACKHPVIEPVITPEAEPIVIPAEPSVQTGVTCSPLPSWQPFQNPLNPCQICICHEKINILGITEAEIDCTQNQDCVLPPESEPLPPTPDGLPVPLRICEEFPQNVMFPHPEDACKLCRCHEEPSPFGLLQPKITCARNPGCTPRILPMPFPDVIPTEPIFPVPQGPVIFPEVIVTPEPFPWPSMSPPIPAAVPGPLPGAPPHESCQPFTPGQTFQHPWDECQLCMCTEARAPRLITIEINCYTKNSCCNELAIDHLGPVTPAVQMIDNLCEFKTLGVDFIHPQDDCKICTCDLFNGVIKATCKKAIRSECSLYPIPGNNKDIVETQTAAIAQSNTVPSFLPSYNTSLPNQGWLYDTNGVLPIGYPGYQKYQAQEPHKLIIPNALIKEYGKYIQPSLTAESPDANGYLKPDTNGFTGYRPQYGLADKEAITIANNDLNRLKGLHSPNHHQYTPSLTYPITNFYYPDNGNSASSAISHAEASTEIDQQTNHPGLKFPGPSWTGIGIPSNFLSGYNKILYPSLATKGSTLNDQTNTYGGGNLYPGTSGSLMYPTLLAKPGHAVQPLYYPGQEIIQNFSDQAQSQALAQVSGSKINAMDRGNTPRVRTKTGETDGNESADDK